MGEIVGAMIAVLLLSLAIGNNSRKRLCHTLLYRCFFAANGSIRPYPISSRRCNSMVMAILRSAHLQKEKEGRT